MLDAALRPRLDPLLEPLAARLARRGVRANTVTLLGFAVGLAAMALVAAGFTWTALLFLLANRAADGLDGAIARRTELTDRGGFLDIVCDFIVYAGIVFAFALLDPARNGLAAAFLIFSFMGTGSSFLAFAIMAAKRRLETTARGRKSIYYLGGLTEGTETILFLMAFCLFPALFVPLALLFGALCWITTMGRILIAWRELG